MAASQRPGEITYYEELGVENTASSDEIRDAFRALARLLHPDAQTDPQLKDMAERQMRKLNRIYSVLSDSARRAAYNESLNSSRNAPIIVFSGSDGNLKKLMIRLGTASAIIFGTFLLIWFALDSNNTQEVRGQDARGVSPGRANEVADGEQVDRIAQLNARIRTLETERNSALAKLGQLGGKPQDQPPQTKLPTRAAAAPAAATTLAELPTAAKPTADPPPVTAPAPSAPAVGVADYAGVWVYSKPGASSASPGGKAQYPPEFIELTVTELKGTLRGQYHSRYQVLDHAVSPDVDFVFAGTPGGGSLSCPWQGPGGSKGRLTLKLVSSNTVEVSWNATELGSLQWLVNGTATLAKK